jgi:hypothetical protein
MTKTFVTFATLSDEDAPAYAWMMEQVAQVGVSDTAEVTGADALLVETIVLENLYGDTAKEGMVREMAALEAARHVLSKVEAPAA